MVGIAKGRAQRIFSVSHDCGLLFLVETTIVEALRTDTRSVRIGSHGETDFGCRSIAASLSGLVAACAIDKSRPLDPALH